MKIGFIGFGNMARAIADGLIKTNRVNKEDLIFSTQTLASREKIEKEMTIQGVQSNQKVIDFADIILLAVKPHQIDSVLGQLSVPETKTVVSVAAGYPTDKLTQYLSEKQVLRVMPNLNAQVGESMTAIIDNPAVPSEAVNSVDHLFKAVGETVSIPEEQLSLFIGLAGSSPALVFMFIDTLARSAVKYGMPKEKAVKIASQAVLGSGKTALHSDSSPWNLIDQVSSPGGITVEAVLSLLQSDFSDAVVTSFDRMIEKDKEMSGK